MKLIFTYLLIMNVLGLALMLIDKYRARKKLWRIRESALMGVAILGGSPGVLAGMVLARHKTKHPKFTIGVPVILALQLLASVWLPA